MQLSSPTGNNFQELLDEQVRAYDELTQKYCYISDYRNVLNHANDVLVQKRQNFNPDQESFLNRGQLLHQMAGTIDTDQLMRFQRMIFRATRGNVFQSNKDVPKQVVL